MDAGRILTSSDKSLPAWAAGLSASEFLARSPRVADLWTPALVLEEAALDANIAFLADFAASRGLELMPHGKTTMAPALWRRQLDAGATGITVATPWQLRVARDAGVTDVMLANQLSDPPAIVWLADDLAARGGRVWSWVDSPEAVEVVEEALRDRDAQLEVLVELGRDGGRTGVRTLDDAVRLAERVAASPVLRLAGVAGYEGAVAKGRGQAPDAEARTFVADLVDLGRRIRPLGDDGDAIVTAGGSAYPDVVADVFAAEGDPATRFVLRSGASLVHDEGYYRSVSPFEGAGLRPAARGIARVVSAPEPGLVLVDAGKRDFPYDEGMPVPLFALSTAGRTDLAGARTRKLNDQHAFVELSPDTALRIGDIVVFGLSHPCTMFDKWRVIPVVDSIDDVDSAIVTDLVETFF